VTTSLLAATACTALLFASAAPPAAAAAPADVDATPGMPRAPAVGSDDAGARSVAELAAALAGAGIVVHRDLAYQSLPGVDPARQALDVYTHPSLSRAPIVLFLHGGSWRQGDKRAVLAKPLALVPAGYVVASANYRFRPHVDIATMAADVATAVAFLRANAASHGGDPDRIFLMGHSAGAHLVAVVGTNERFLHDAGVPWSALRGVVPLDTGPYHVPRQLERVASVEGGYGDLMRMVFGNDPAQWEVASPWHHVSATTPPFLIVTSDGRGDAAAQAIPFGEHLRAAGVEAAVIEAKGRTHGTLNSELGRPGDATTQAVLDFLARHAATPQP
jgi:acetyl esterase/lipase